MSVQRTDDKRNLFTSPIPRKDLSCERTYVTRELRRHAAVLFASPQWADKNGNNCIETNEIPAYTANITAFSAVDIDKDGKVSCEEARKYSAAGTIPSGTEKAVSGLREKGRYLLSEFPRIELVTEKRLPKEINELVDHKDIADSVAKGQVVTLSLSHDKGRYGQVTNDANKKAVLIIVPENALSGERTGHLVNRQVHYGKQYLDGRLAAYRTFPDIAGILEIQLPDTGSVEIMNSMPRFLSDADAYISSLSDGRDAMDAEYVAYTCLKINSSLMAVNMLLKYLKETDQTAVFQELTDLKDMIVDTEQVDDINNSMLIKYNDKALAIYPDIDEQGFRNLYQRGE